MKNLKKIILYSFIIVGLFSFIYFYENSKSNQNSLQNSLGSIAANSIAANSVTPNNISKEIAQTTNYNVVWLIIKFKKSVNTTKKIDVEQIWLSENLSTSLNGGISFKVDNKTITLNEDYIFMLVKKDKWIHSNFKSLFKEKK